MKIKLKLAYVMMCFITVCVIAINVFITSSVEDSNIQSYQKNISQSTKQQAEILSGLFDEAFTRAKEIVTTDYIESYMQKSNTQKLSQLALDEDFQKVLVEFNSMTKLTPTLKSLILVNNAGVIVASTDAAAIGSSFDDKALLGNLAASRGGISSLTLVSSNNSKELCYYIARNIYSSNNTVQGVFLQLISTSSVQKVLSMTKTYGSGYAALIDLEGNLLQSPYIDLMNYKNVQSYASLTEYIHSAVNGQNSTGANVFTEYVDTLGDDYIVYNTSVSGLNWTLLTFTPLSDMNRKAVNILFQVRVFSILAVILLFVFVFIYVGYFSKPIERIVQVLLKKQRGDQSERFDIKSKDEFGKIGQAFNSMFDDVFESEQRYRTIVEMTDNIIFEINFRKNTVFISNNFNQKFSFRAKTDKLQDSFFYKGRIHKDDKERFFSDFNKILNESAYMQGEYRFKNVYGDFAWVLIRASKFFDRQEVPSKIIGVIVDIDREKKSEMHLLQRATYDALTQLYNRETFLKNLANEFDMAYTRKSLDSVLFIDLDDFKHFNDDFGHSCGDEVLKFVADTLKEITFEKGFAGRFGGDEFVVCIMKQQYFGDSGKIAQDIIDILGKGFISESTDQRLNIHCSIGIAFFNENGKNCDEVLNAADEAMYSVKKHGKSSFAYATPKNLLE